MTTTRSPLSFPLATTGLDDAPRITLDRRDPSVARSGFVRSIFARLTARYAGPYEAQVAERKKQLLGELRGRVVEIGPGAGANLPYYGADIDWIGVEPSVPMQEALLRKARGLELRGSVVTATAEELPFGTASVDVVVSTLVLCSVTDPRRALAEARRVLRPGGRLVFIEHVAAAHGTRLRWKQDLVAPLWSFCSDGCRPNQDTGRLLAKAGFSALDTSSFMARAGLCSPHIAGEAVR